MADWQASQYRLEIRRASALQMMQHLGMGMIFVEEWGTGYNVGNAV
jgi:hypothetical protein